MLIKEKKIVYTDIPYYSLVRLLSGNVERCYRPREVDVQAGEPEFGDLYPSSEEAVMVPALTM